jgi:hypothetical protein
MTQALATAGLAVGAFIIKSIHDRSDKATSICDVGVLPELRPIEVKPEPIELKPKPVEAKTR